MLKNGMMNSHTGHMVRILVLTLLGGLLTIGITPNAAADSAVQGANGTGAAPAFSCPNARFRKHIVVTDTLIYQPPPDVSHLGRALSARLITNLEAMMPIDVHRIEATRSHGPQPATDAFARFGTPYFIRLAATGTSLTGSNSRFSFWGPSYDPRGAKLTVSVYDGSSADRLGQFSLTANPVDSGRFQPVIDAQSDTFWNSAYGQTLNKMLQRAAVKIRDLIGCEPMVGTVTAVNGNQLTIDIGQRDGLKAGDSVLVIQRGQPVPTLGDHRPLTHQDQSLGFAKIRYTDMNSARLTLNGPQPAVVGDLVWTGERTVPDAGGH